MSAPEARHRIREPMISYERLVRDRQPLWDEFERELDTAHRTPRALGFRGLEKLALQYRQVLHDHALAASRFPGTVAARRLQALAVEGGRWLRREHARERGGLRRFFGRTFPRAFQRGLPEIGVSAGLFATTALLGFFLSIVQPSLGAAFLGPEALSGLREGRLWTDSLVTAIPPAWASSAIATNNMSVAITAFAGGAAAGLGALYVVLMNGFMLGAIVALTSHYGMAPALLEFVAAHGPLEITLILTTAGAGLVMGRALIQATDRPRREVLREAGRDATVVLVGCLPWFLVLGIVEGFVSPAPGVSTLPKVALGVSLLVLFLALALRAVPHVEVS